MLLLLLQLQLLLLLLLLMLLLLLQQQRQLLLLQLWPRRLLLPRLIALLCRVEDAPGLMENGLRDKLIPRGLIAGVVANSACCASVASP